MSVCYHRSRYFAVNRWVYAAVGLCYTIVYAKHFRLRIRRNFLIMHVLEKLSYEFHELITVQILNFEGELSYYVTGSTIHYTDARTKYTSYILYSY